MQERDLTLLVFVLGMYAGLMILAGVLSRAVFRDSTEDADTQDKPQFHIPVSVILMINAVIVGLILIVMAYLQLGQDIGITTERLSDFVVIFIGLPIFLWVAWHEALEPILSTLRDWYRESQVNDDAENQSGEDGS
ncbi:MAG: hypothetical protein ACLFTK_07400 [Anaerolineales bacterium]